MIIQCEEDFCESLIGDLNNNRDCWIIFQNIKWNVNSIKATEHFSAFKQRLYDVDISIRKDVEQLCLL